MAGWCGLLGALSVPGAFADGFWPLGIAACAWWWTLLLGASARRRWLVSFTVGFVQMAIGISWFAEFSVPGAVLSMIGEAAFIGLAGLVTDPRRDRAWTFVAGVVLAEALRSAWPFGGIPLAGLDLGQAVGPLVGGARLGGRVLVVGMTAALGVAAAEALSIVSLPRRASIRRRFDALRPTIRRSPVRAASALGLAAVALAAAGATWPVPTQVGSITTAAVQGGGPRGFRATETSAVDVFRRHAAATADLLEHRAPGELDLIVWPEDVVDVETTVTETDEGEILSKLALASGATLVAGVVEDEGTDHFRNAVAAWDPDGQPAGRYEKVRRVPFGEYFPFRDIVKELYEIPARDALPGDQPGFIATPAADLGFVISYEAFLPDRARAAVRAGAEVLLIPTNSASFKGSIVPNQQIAAARLRAWETGRDVVQAGPTGYSAFLTVRGAVHFQTALGTAETVVAPVPLRKGLTPYARFGDWPLLAAAVVGAAASRVRRQA
jgi:apolipoprotein N-acyltransferase